MGVVEGEMSVSGIDVHLKQRLEPQQRKMFACVVDLPDCPAGTSTYKLKVCLVLS